MELVLDSNVLIAALIRESHTRDLILSSGWTFYAPEFLVEEINEHLQELSAKTKLSNDELRVLLAELLTTSETRVIPKNQFKEELKKARKFTPDPDDAEYFAVALLQNCALWSNDRKLQDQKSVRVYTTAELSKLRDSTRVS